MTDEITQNDCQGEGPEFVERAEWRQRGGKNGDRNYQYFREMFPALDDQIIDQFKLGFGATILYEDMSQEELGKLIYNAIAIGFVSGKQQATASDATAEIARLNEQLTEAREIIKSFHLEYVDYSVLNHLSGHNNHNVKWARRFLGMKEEWSLDEARAFLTKGETDNG